MKKTYLRPEIEIQCFAESDVVMASFSIEDLIK